MTMKETVNESGAEQQGAPLLGKVFAGAMIGFFIMVCLGLAAIYYYQISSPQPEPVPFMDPSTIQQ
jgi:hypothetical protein